MKHSLRNLRQALAKEFGIQDVSGKFDFDDTTYPTKDEVNDILNSVMRQLCGRLEIPYEEWKDWE